MFKTALLVVCLSAQPFCYAFAQDGAEDEERRAYLLKRAEEKAAAEQAVRELATRDQSTLSADESIRLCRAYNELGDNRLALEAICRVPDGVLAEKQALETKAICYGNARGEDPALRVRELAFIDRCLDRKYGNRGQWLWCKAKLVCQASVSSAVPTRGDEIGSEARIIDREQYEYAFELLVEAFRAEPKLIERGGIGPELLWPQDFPLLSAEARFKQLIERRGRLEVQ